MTDITPKNIRQAAQTAYGILWHLQTDDRDPRDAQIALARKQLLAMLSKEDQASGIDRAKWLGAGRLAIDIAKMP